jgi:hypothetical protein
VSIPRSSGEGIGTKLLITLIAFHMMRDLGLSLDTLTTKLIWFWEQSMKAPSMRPMLNKRDKKVESCAC